MADLLGILQQRFGLAQFRPHQEAICDAILQGNDTLVVMPTGAGKSLCYQLPGLARKGPTLVISPLVALIEDQVQRLVARGLRADRIHSGRERGASREAFKAYLRKELEFLFIAPERLRVPGFSEMLSQHPPTLIAVDEAHCISQWGHDFRPDYRLVGERLKGLDQTPIVALTATATPKVQADIEALLQLRKPKRFIHGFRRTNIAVRVLETPQKERADRILEILSAEGRLPAIIYASTRKKAEELAQDLKSEIPCAAYHAGLEPEERERVQSRFLEGRLQLIVATVAFGMGIDKANIRTVIHSGIPASLENYYQEIGRAGRDGKPSEAHLLHAYADRKTHEFFIESDYPDPDLLEKVRKKAPQTASVPQGEFVRLLRAELGLEEPLALKAIEKLTLHGGLQADSHLNVLSGAKDWKKPYQAQRRHRLEQLEAVIEFTESTRCRMLELIEHFGDPSDSGKACKQCDRCLPGKHLRNPDPLELSAAKAVLAILSDGKDQSLGRVFDECVSMDRRIAQKRSGFDKLISALSRAGLVEIQQAEFEKEGRVIKYRRVSQTPTGAKARPDTLKTLEIEGPGLA
jgi:DNA topoisomerase-3